MSIEVRDLLKTYGEQKAVNHISFSVQKGEIAGFLGPNGAGKSTTMKIITGFLNPDEGSVTVCGIPVTPSGKEPKKKIGYLPEANALYYDMYVREYLGFMAGVHQLPHPAEKIEEVIALVGLSREAHKKIGQLSKGYKQRTGLAAALLHDPEVLILDEPTSGLDPNQIVEIREVIKKLGQNKTVLFSSHILQEVEALCDRVIIINKGQLVADDHLSRLRQEKTGTQTLLVYFREKVDQAQLLSIAEIQHCEALPPSDEAQSGFKLLGVSTEAIRKQLLELSLQQGWNIVSLQTETKSLESIFRELTK